MHNGEREQALTRWVVPLVILIVFAGFARTLYLRPLFHPAPTALIFVAHGTIMTAWLLTFATQAVLVDRNRPDLHRAIGPYAAALAALATIVGLAALYFLIVLKRGINLFSGEFLGFFVAEDGLSIVLFGAFVAAGIIVRRRRDLHNVLMIMAAVNLLPPAVLRSVSILAQRLMLWDSLGRLPGAAHSFALVISQHVALIVFGVMASIVIAIAAFTRKRPTSSIVLWGGAAMIINYAATFYLRIQG